MHSDAPEHERQDPAATVMVLNGHVDTMDMLEMALKTAGFSVATGAIAPFRNGEADLLQELQRVRPRVLLYDLAIPYEENWAFLQKVRADPRFTECELVLTTTNERAVRNLLGIAAMEIIGKPYDLQQVVDAVAGAVTGKPSPPQPVSDRRTGERRSGSDRRDPARAPE